MKDKMILAMQFIIVAAIFLLIFGLIGCGIYAEANRPTEGIVIRKDYEPAHTETVYKRVKVNDDYISVPTEKVITEKYTITIKGINKKGKEVTYSFSVPMMEYDKTEIGELYILEGK